MKIPLLAPLLLVLLAGCAARHPSSPPPEAKAARIGHQSLEYTDLSTAYGQLLDFQDDPVFLKHGFTANSPHAGWLDHVRALGRRPGYSPDAARLLTMLAVAIKQQGKDSAVARDFTAQFEKKLGALRIKPTPEAVQIESAQTVAPTPPAAHSAVVSILYTGDTQGVLFPQPAHGSSVGGLSRRLPLLTQLRATEPNAVLLDAGDAFTDARTTAKRNNAAIVTAMNRMHYDAMGLGPHDLAVGEVQLRSLVSQATFPVICSNLALPDGETWIKPYALITRGSASIAVLSLLPATSAVQIAGARLTSPNEALRRHVAVLQGKANLILLLTQALQAEVETMLAGSDIDAVIGDTYGHAVITRPAIFPAMAKGLGVGEIQLNPTDGALLSHSMRILDKAVVDAELKNEIQIRK